MQRTASRVFLVVAVSALVLAGCSSSKSTTASTTTAAPGTTGAAAPLRIMVTNDDGYSAPGIDAVVQGLRTLPDVQVSVVAPADQRERLGRQDDPGHADGHRREDGQRLPGQGGGRLSVRHGDLGGGRPRSGPEAPGGRSPGSTSVRTSVSTVNISGTVGAARAAASRGIPALASPVPDCPRPAWPAPTTPMPSTQVENVGHPAPSRPGGGHRLVACAPPGPERAHLRGGLEGARPGHRPRGPQRPGARWRHSGDCASTATGPTSDVQAFAEGFEPLSNLSVTPTS